MRGSFVASDSDSSGARPVTRENTAGSAREAEHFSPAYLVFVTSWKGGEVSGGGGGGRGEENVVPRTCAEKRERPS